MMTVLKPKIFPHADNVGSQAPELREMMILLLVMLELLFNRLWHREHNRIAGKLKSELVNVKTDFWSLLSESEADDLLFQETQKII